MVKRPTTEAVVSAEPVRANPTTVRAVVLLPVELPPPVVWAPEVVVVVEGGTVVDGADVVVAGTVVDVVTAAEVVVVAGGIVLVEVLGTIVVVVDPGGRAAQVGLVMTLESRVTAPLRARSRP